MKRLLTFIASVALLASCCCGEKAPKTEYVVDCNGKGDYTSLQECLDALPSKSPVWRTITVKEGVYREKVTIDVYKDKLTIVGEGDVKIVWDDHTGKVVDGYTMTTYDSWTMSIQADEVHLQNLTIENSAGRVGQAVAVETRGDRIIIENCRMLGNQDTFFTKDYVARVYVKNCYIEGTTDFIFGASTTVFDNCEIHCKQDSYITAASTAERTIYGYIFRNCRISCGEEVTAMYLGRPWKSTGRTVWIECYMPEQIHPEGWHNWGAKDREERSFYAEYKCYGPGADRSKRVKWSHELTDEQVANEYTLEKIFALKVGSEQYRWPWNGTFNKENPAE
ncbi:MAG: right-handed parallel beta-helix repeat-containing protein [Alistipes sp.]|nr:right-handed parallel beta-helix repeat-containing protein [Alistipes sp.]MBQ2844379.1 right-handed parallel beta-helix repeat-containing protein [Alistipes sp.]